uniref:Hemerythrin-like domain-containing protein n=1 Tax=Ditylum brightwellii TaxID=49249 RepID=A0A6S8Y349_9STRA|mmetsp:Transcript_21043/g.30522  ORF Transcript_21043/g.30522 Transcript_21043/m.30522 type:complete len:262 (-) Transcript_21043:112-897(-)
MASWLTARIVGNCETSLNAQVVLEKVGEKKPPSSSNLIKDETEEKEITDEEVTSALEKFGIQKGDASMEEMRKCLKVVEGKRFWVENYQVHPYASRVKKWLWVHERYRGYGAALVDGAKELEKVKEKEVKNKLKALQSAYGKFVKKVQGHSEFEDSQLFKFFLENVQDDTLKEQLEELKKDHSTLDNDETIQNAFEAAFLNEVISKDDTTKILELMTKFTEDMDQHMRKEENAIVHHWLNLTEEQYKKYRTYLSWKYAAMY